jgi:hypothetical protein
MGRLHAKLRLGIELDHEAQIFGQGINFFHIENWYSVHSVIRTTLRLLGLYWRGRKNAEQIQVRHNHIRMKRLPSRFDGFTLLHISDLHVDMNEGAMRRLTELLPDLVRHSGRLTPHSMASRGYAPLSRIQSTACWEIMTLFVWCLDLKKWASECCSTNASQLYAAIKRSI